MAMPNDLRAQVLELPRDERAKLASELLASLDEPADDPAAVEAAWLAEVHRRMSEVEAGTVELVDWDTVRQQLADRLDKR